MRIPVDVGSLKFRCASPPREDTDFETGRPKQNREGRPLLVVDLWAMDGQESEQIRVRVPGPVSLAQDDPVRVVGLSCLHWSMGDRSGLSFAAEHLEAAKGGGSK